MSLARLLEQATPGPWEASTGGSFYVAELRAPSPYNGFALVKVMTNAEHDLALIALAPDMARLLIDMADAMKRMQHDYLASMPTCDCPHCRAIRPLLARFAELDGQAKEGT